MPGASHHARLILTYAHTPTGTVRGAQSGGCENLCACALTRLSLLSLSLSFSLSQREREREREKEFTRDRRWVWRLSGAQCSRSAIPCWWHWRSGALLSAATTVRLFIEFFRYFDHLISIICSFTYHSYIFFSRL